MGLAALVATAVLVVGVSPAMAGKSHPGFYGVYYQAQQNTHKDVSKMQDANVKNVRMALRWAAVQPREGEAPNWSTYDDVIGDMAAHGIQVLPVLIATPHWVENSGGKPPVGSKADRQAWKSFVTQAVNRYGRGGSYWRGPLGFAKDHPGKSPEEIKAWQVWNEENLQHYFKTKQKRVKKYANLVKITHDAVKQGDAGATVVLGGLVGNGRPSGSMNAWKFLDKLYKKRGIKRSFDVAAIHPYATSIQYVKKWIRKFRAVMKKHHDSKSGVWVTEVGWGSDPPDRYGFNKGRQGQKKMLNDAFRTLHSKRHKLGLRRVYWFTFRDPKHGNARCSFCGSAGLLKSNFHTKPSWRAFKRFT